MDALTTWIAQHTPVYYGPALIAFGVVFKFTDAFGIAILRNLLRGFAFALLLGSKFVVTNEGVSPVPLWQHALSGSAGFALVALGFWTIGGFGVSQLLDALVETLKAASKAMRNSVIYAALLMILGAIGALVAAPLGAMVDARFSPPPLALPAEIVPQAVDAIAPATPPVAAPASQTAPNAAIAPAIAPAATPATAPVIPPAAAPSTAATPPSH